MITKIGAFQTSDTQTFATVELARQHELESLTIKGLAGWDPDKLTEVAEFITVNSDAIVDILTMKATSRPAGRKVNRKKGGAKGAAAAAAPAAATSEPGQPELIK